MTKPPERRFETVFVKSDVPPNLRIMVQLITEKIKRGELNEYELEKRKIR